MGYALSNLVYVFAQHQIGAARAGVIFSSAILIGGTTMACALGQGEFTPYIGAGLGLALLGVAIQAAERPRTAPEPDEEAQAA